MPPASACSNSSNHLKYERVWVKQRFEELVQAKHGGAGAFTAFGVPGHQPGTVAISPADFGLDFPEVGRNVVRRRTATQAFLAPLLGQIRIAPEGLNLHGAPAPPYGVSDIGDRNIRRASGTNFDLYGFPTDQAAKQFGVQRVRTTITLPRVLNCPEGFQEKQ